MNRHFAIEVADTRPDGSRSPICDELGPTQTGRLRRLASLTDAFVMKARKLKQWPDGADRSWVLLPLGPDIALCQWNPGDPELWDLGIGYGVLVVVRVVPRSEAKTMLDEEAEKHHD